MKYSFKGWCRDCTEIDNMGCFDGGYYYPEQDFETKEEADSAGLKWASQSIWDYEVIEKEEE